MKGWLTEDVVCAYTHMWLIAPELNCSQLGTNV